MATVDSRTLKTKSAKGKWDDHLEFELLPTTQLVEISVWKSDNCRGFIQIQIAK